MTIALDEEQKAIVDSVKKGHNVFFSGQAGTGKSVVFRALRESLGHGDDLVQFAAITGLAATAIGTAWIRKVKIQCHTKTRQGTTAVTTNDETPVCRTWCPSQVSPEGRTYLRELPSRALILVKAYPIWRQTLRISSLVVGLPPLQTVAPTLLSADSHPLPFHTRKSFAYYPAEFERGHRESRVVIFHDEGRRRHELSVTFLIVLQKPNKANN